MKSLYLFYLLLLASRIHATDMFGPFYGNYLASDQSISSCLNACSACCIVWVNITEGTPNVFVNVKLNFDPNSLTRCNAQSLAYSTTLNYNAMMPENAIQTLGELGGFTPPPQIEMDFYQKPSDSVFIYNRGCSTPVEFMSGVSDETLTSSTSIASVNQPFLTTLYHLIF
jgi:hypothetical protein